jgi:hypothetical protein
MCVQRDHAQIRRVTFAPVLQNDEAISAVRTPPLKADIDHSDEAESRPKRASGEGEGLWDLETLLATMQFVPNTIVAH